MPPASVDSREFKKAKRQNSKATKDRNPLVNADWTPFRAAEKRYKARFPRPELSDVLDLAALDEQRVEEIAAAGWVGKPDAVEIERMQPRIGDAPLYKITPISGLVILPSFISHERQRTLVKWALASHSCHPNETNLDIHYNLPTEGVWSAALAARNGCAPDVLVHPKASTAGESEISEPGPRLLVNNASASKETFQAISSTPKLPQAPSSTVLPTFCSDLVYKLRWANIGWFYHWGSKQYDFTKGRGHIDEELREICKSAVATVDWPQVFTGTEEDWGSSGHEWLSWDKTYEPDAGIVNFYQTKDTLMAHVDRSEVCATSPLVSISLGNAAVFLIGGKTRDAEPIPILLRSGDVVIMSGPICRRAYHGVPRILEGTLPKHLKCDIMADVDWAPYEEYMRTTRININVRQVFPKGFVHEMFSLPSP